MAVAERDRLVLRDLAKQYRDICESDRNFASKELWRKHNSLKDTRPLVFVASW